MSWKSQGGIYPTEKSNNINVDTVVANNIILKNKYIGTFDVSGSLIVQEDLDVKGELNIQGNTLFTDIHTNSLAVNNDASFLGTTSFIGDITTQSNLNSVDINLEGNIDIQKNINFLGTNETLQHFVSSDPSGIFLDNILNTPHTHTLQIYGENEQSFSVGSHTLINKNILASNAMNSKIETHIDSFVTSSDPGFQRSDNTKLSIDFTGGTNYSDLPSESSETFGNAHISYHASENNVFVGDLEISAPNNIFLSRSTVVNDRDDSNNENKYLNEPLTIYDNSSNVYFETIYDNPYAYTGSSATFIANDKRSTTFTNHLAYYLKQGWEELTPTTGQFTYTPIKSGSAYGGGVYPNDVTRSFATMGIRKENGDYLPSQNVVQGKDPVKYFTTTAINTYKPRTEEYVMEINGPTRIDNGDIEPVVDADMEIDKISISGPHNNLIGIIGSSVDISGSYSYNNNENGNLTGGYRQKILLSSDYGSTWKSTLLYPIGIQDSTGTLNKCMRGPTLNDLLVIDNSFAIAVGFDTIIYTNSLYEDASKNWFNMTDTTVNDINDYKNVVMVRDVDNVRFYFSTSNKICYIDTTFSFLSGINVSVTINFVNTSVVDILCLTVNTNFLFAGGDDYIYRYSLPNLNDETLVKQLNVEANNKYTQIVTHGEDLLMAIGNGIISVTKNCSVEQADPFWYDTYYLMDLKSIHLQDANNAIIVGDEGRIIITRDGGETWQDMPLNIVNASGKSILLLDPTYNLSVVGLTDSNTLLISKVIQGYDSTTYGKSILYNVFAPNYINKEHNTVLDLSGNMNTSGYISINDGGDIRTTMDDFNLFTHPLNTLNIGTQCESIVLGTSDFGNTIIQNDLYTTHKLNIDGNLILQSNLGIGTDSPEERIDVSGNVLIHNNVFVGQDISGSGNLYVDGSSHFNDIAYFYDDLLVSSSQSIITNRIDSNDVQTESVKFGSVTRNIELGYENTSYNKTINIGAVNDQVFINGKLFVQTENDLSANNTNPVFNPAQLYLNADAGIDQHGTSAGAGIYFIDNSNNLNAAFMKISDDLQGFTFMAPSIDANNQTLSNPLKVKFSTNSFSTHDLSRTLVIVQPSSIVPQDISSNAGDSDFTITTTPIDISFLVLNSESSLVNPQTLGTDLIVEGSTILTSLTSNQTDLSGTTNITGECLMTGNVTVDGKLSVSDTAEFNGNIGLNGTVDVSGNLFIGQNYFSQGNVVLYNDTNLSTIHFASETDSNYAAISFYKSVVGTEYNNYFNYSGNNNSTLVITSQTDSVGDDADNILLRPSGSIIIDACSNTIDNIGQTIIQPFGGNVGIGQIYPQYPLDIHSDTRFLSSVQSYNYDNMTFSKDFGNVFVDTNVSVGSDSCWQDIAISYDSQYIYATSYNAYSESSLYLSRDRGGNWTDMSLNMGNSNNSIVQAVPHLVSNDTSFNTYAELLNSVSSGVQPLHTQIGQYFVSGSSQFQDATTYFKAFDDLSGTSWISNALYSNSSNPVGQYTGTVSTDLNNFPYGATTTNVPGEYLQIQLPYNFIVESFNFLIYNDQTTNNSNSYPRHIYLVGSNNNSDWNYLFDLSLNDLNVDVNDILNTTIESGNIINSQSYIYYRFIVDSVLNKSGLTGVSTGATFSNINIAGRTLNSAGTIGTGIATSGTGQYVSVINKTFNNNQGNIFVNNDYGVGDFVDTEVQAGNDGTWQSIAISQKGQYQYAVIGASHVGANIFISNDYGSSWTDSYMSVQNGWQSISVSSDGKYVSAVQSGNLENPFGGIYYSHDYGQTWNSDEQIYSYVPYNNAFGNQGYNSFDRTIALSVSGKYQVAVGLATTEDLSGSANIWINNNYGQGLWTDTSSRAPSTDGPSIFTSISINGSGQYQIAGYLSYNTIDNSYNGNIITSNDYGSTWEDRMYSPTDDSYQGYFNKSVISTNGQYITSIPKYVDPSNTLNNNIVSYGNIVASSVHSFDDNISINYLGSSYSGNVDGVHALKINVPNDNNSSLMFGYDSAWNSVYINASDKDQQGKNICFNTNDGGHIGIGTHKPRVALDVVGSISSSDLVSAQNFRTESDYRIKQNISDLDSHSIDHLRPVEYDLKNGRHDMGFLAHEVQDVFPFLVSGEKDGQSIQSINYNGIIPVLVKEIQVLKHRIQVLESQK